MDVKEIATMRGIGEKTVAKAYGNKLDIFSLFILAGFFVCSLNQIARAQNAQKLIEQFGNTSFLCTSPDIPAADMAKACEEREGIWDELTELGYSYGCDDEAESNIYWRQDCNAPQESVSQTGDALKLSCKATSDDAIKIAERSTFGVIKLRKINVATISEDGNHLLCKLIVDGKINGIAQNQQALAYTATLLDDRSGIWIEFQQPDSRAGNSSVFQMGVTSMRSVQQPIAPPIPMRTYNHLTGEYTNYYIRP